MTAAEGAESEPAKLNALAALAQREHAAGRLAEAAAAYREIVALRPDYAEAHNNLGIVLSQLGDFGQARLHFERTAALRPDYAEVHNNLGSVALHQGRLEEAEILYRRAMAIGPNYSQAYYNLGRCLVEQEKLNEAVTPLERALALDPNHADATDAHYNLGNILAKQGNLAGAATQYELVLARNPAHAGAHHNLGLLLEQQGELERAAARFREALAIQPDFTLAHYSLGNLLAKKGALADAATHYRQAISLRPDYPEAHYALGNVAWISGHLDEALAHYQQAVTFRTSYGEAWWGLAACYLVMGDYQRGWQAHERRANVPGLEPRDSFPRWSGEPLVGRSLLLLPEQGLGDTVQFIRYARALKERGARVVLACPPALGRMLASQADIDEVFILGSAEDLPDCDFYLPLLSAPWVLGTTAATIPGDVPYLTADPRLTDAWRAELAGGEFKIGIAWQGSPDYYLDRWRSIPLAAFAPLAAVPGVRLISLQKGFGSEQIAMVDFPVLDIAGRLDNEAGPFMDTAAVIQTLDLVVTPDTVLAHLAGALGARVWTALAFSPDWRWLRDRDDTPWYPSMRLFRQMTFGDWSAVFARMAGEVQALCGRQLAARPQEDS
ncbi:MAG TPA: tetratricopeptide repeat-containing glycosyltransferase family protein [Pirellulales bacterium]|nr:tetratricopeptide repeat-containing glycosyltransferase family protein [Pirellulales bacterium]